MKPLILLVLLTWSALSLASKCPPEEELKPHCWCLESYYGGALYCEDFNSPLELTGPIEACRGYEVTALGLFNSTLLYFPSDLFKGTSFEKISLVNTVLMSLSNGPLAFEGLEDTLEELRATKTHYVTQWRFNQLRELKQMNLIDINWIHMEAIEDFPDFPKLTAMGVIHAGLTFIGDEAFAKCPKIQILDLRHNLISELRRSMLPKPANSLIILNLEDNELSTLPEDFFTDMPQLEQILLKDNQFTTIQESTFSRMFGQINTLDLRGNEISCDCRIMWLVHHKTPRWFQAVCAKPPSLEGAPVNTLTTRHLRC